MRIINQMTETHRVRDLARLVSEMSGVPVAPLANPRKEAPENDLVVVNDTLLHLGLQPTTLSDGLLSEVVEVARRHADRIDRSRIVSTSLWIRPSAEPDAAKAAAAE